MSSLYGPTTAAEARVHRYGTYRDGAAYRPYKCAYECADQFRLFQCSRVPGYGPDNLFCKQHAAIVERTLKG